METGGNGGILFFAAPQGRHCDPMAVSNRELRLRPTMTSWCNLRGHRPVRRPETAVCIGAPNVSIGLLSHWSGAAQAAPRRRTRSSSLCEASHAPRDSAREC